MASLREIAGPLSIGYFVASRLAYVLGVGTALLLQKRRQRFTRLLGVAGGFARFRTLAATIMNNDAVAFVVMCWFTRGTLPLPVVRWVAVALGLAGIACGIGIKLWARSGVGPTGYYWYDFFDPGAKAPAVPQGPYRYLNNPMYTVGYLHAYGFALLVASLPGLILAAFAQLAILGFFLVVERPHFKALSVAWDKAAGKNEAPG